MQATHTVDEFAPATEDAVPGAQGEQSVGDVAPATAKEPAAHTSGEHAVAPPTANVPTRQVAHAPSAPEVGDAVPGAQDEHCVDDVAPAGANEPAAQSDDGEHTVLLMSEV